MGDLAFLHDLGSLPAAARMGAELTVAVLDNGGGAIFGMLPIARSPGVDLERLFTFPHHLDLTEAASGLGARVRRAGTLDMPGVLAQAAEEGGTWGGGGGNRSRPDASRLPTTDRGLAGIRRRRT